MTTLTILNTAIETETLEPQVVQKHVGKKTVRLTDLRAGETGRIVRVALPDSGCRKRFSEMGLAEGMKVTVVSTGDTLMVALGTVRMGLACRCAQEITVVKCPA